MRTGWWSWRPHARTVVWAAAAFAALSRLPGLVWPLRPDEAGFLLVARAWDPQPDSPYGTYWVDRPPPLLWVIQWSDRIGGPYFHRVVGAAACALLVVAAAAAAREIVRTTTWATPALERRTAACAAVAAAALVANSQLDVVAAKGEVFALPLVMGACWLALRAVRTRSWAASFAGGMLAALAVGMKQSMVGGLVMGGTVLVGALLTRQLDLRRWVLLTAAATLGALTPVAATLGWALGAGVDPQALWYVTVTFRSDASDVLSHGQSTSAALRAAGLFAFFCGTGMVIVLGWLVARGHRAVRHVRVPSVAVVLVLLVDITVSVLSGSYWKPYLFALIPGLVLAVACLVASQREQGEPGRPASRTPYVVVGLTVLSSVVSMAAWIGWWALGTVPEEVRTGHAIAAASEPGETLVVYGGRADIQWASGLPSPYPQLWSLPMRTLDPHLADLNSLLDGPHPPTWFVAAVPLDSWHLAGSDQLQDAVSRHYDPVATACDTFGVYRLRSAPAADFAIDCTTPSRGLFGRTS